jgi:hypothetical protein
MKVHVLLVFIVIELVVEFFAIVPEPAFFNRVLLLDLLRVLPRQDIAVLLEILEKLRNALSRF